MIANNSGVREKDSRINIEDMPRIILLIGPAKAIFPSVELGISRYHNCSRSNNLQWNKWKYTKECEKYPH